MADRRDRLADLVEVAARSRPPVVRIMDWGRYQYEQQQRAKDARKKQHTVSVKEVKLRPRNDDHDLEFKLRNARRLLNLKITVRFRGPELRRPDLGHDVLDTVQEDLSDYARVEARLRTVEGRQLTMMLAPERQPRSAGPRPECGHRATFLRMFIAVRPCPSGHCGRGVDTRISRSGGHLQAWPDRQPVREPAGHGACP